MKVEVLFPEICNLYGELANIEYLKRSCPEIRVSETRLTDEPLFASHTPDLIYMGTMTEKSQLIVLEKLKPYAKRLDTLIAEGTRFLITGNALEIFGSGIEDADGTKTECLGFFDTIAKRDMVHRFNSLYLGELDSGDSGMGVIKIAGFKSQFTHSYWVDKQREIPLFMTERGPGLNPELQGEGIRKNNFMATYVIGPLLVLNPPLAKYILHSCGMRADLAFEDAAMDAYTTRINEYADPNTGFYY